MNSGFGCRNSLPGHNSIQPTYYLANSSTRWTGKWSKSAQQSPANVPDMGLQASHEHRPKQRQPSMGERLMPPVPKLWPSSGDLRACPSLQPFRPSRDIDALDRSAGAMVGQSRHRPRPPGVSSGIRQRTKRTFYDGDMQRHGQQVPEGG